METTADELKDRYTQIGEFLRDNDADKAIKDGDEKEIENLIDAGNSGCLCILCYFGV